MHGSHPVEGKRVDERLPDIPGDIVELFTKVISLCKEAGCHSVSLSIQASKIFRDHGNVSINWTSGRHGEKAGAVIRTEVTKRIEV